MARAPLTYRQADLTRALKGAQAAGLEVGRVDIDPKTGRITILTVAVAEAAGGIEREPPEDAEVIL